MGVFPFLFLMRGSAPFASNSLAISIAESIFPAVAGAPVFVTARWSGVDRIRLSTALTCCARSEKLLDGRRAAKSHSPMQRRHAVFVPLVDRHSALNEIPDDTNLNCGIRIVRGARGKERSAEITALANQSLEAIKPEFDCRLVNLAHDVVGSLCRWWGRFLCAHSAATIQ